MKRSFATARRRAGFVLLAAALTMSACTDADILTRRPGETTTGSYGQACADTELHVFGSYESRSTAADPTTPWPPPVLQQDTRVRIDRPGRHKLVLSAYNPTRWLVDAAADAAIVEIVVVGYHAQQVELGPGVVAKIEIQSHEQGGETICGYSWPYNGGGCDTQELLDFAARVGKQPVDSFHGCYQVDSWTLQPDMSVQSTCGGDSGGYPLYELIRPESMACGTEADEVQVIGVYETRSDHSYKYHPVGNARVRLDRPGRQTLVLSSYEPTDWTVEVGAGVDLAAVYATGYQAQRVKLPAGSSAKVVTTSYETGQDEDYVACGVQLPSDRRGCPTEQLLQWAADKAGRRVTSFRSCYRTANWVIGSDLETSADCESGPLTLVRFD
jgi:hypothetical protein